MKLSDLSQRDRELLALFILGAALGLVAVYMVEAWVIESDQADRRRIREELEKWWTADLGGGPLQELTEAKFAAQVYKAKLAELDRGGDLPHAQDQAAELYQGGQGGGPIDAGGVEGETVSDAAQDQASEAERRQNASHPGTDPATD